MMLPPCYRIENLMTMDDLHSSAFQRERPVSLLCLAFPAAQLIHPGMTFNLQSSAATLHGSWLTGYSEAHLPKREFNAFITLASRAMSHFHSSSYHSSKRAIFVFIARQFITSCSQDKCHEINCELALSFLTHSNHHKTTRGVLNRGTRLISDPICTWSIRAVRRLFRSIAEQIKMSEELNVTLGIEVKPLKGVGALNLL